MKTISNYKKEVENIQALLEQSLKSLEPHNGSIKELDLTWSKARGAVDQIVDRLNDDHTLMQEIINNEMLPEELELISKNNVIRQHEEMFQHSKMELLSVLPENEKLSIKQALIQSEKLLTNTLGQIAYELGLKFLQKGRVLSALNLFITAMFKGHAKSYSSIATVLLDPDNGYSNKSLAKNLLLLGGEAENPLHSLPIITRLPLPATIERGAQFYEQAILLQQEEKHSEALNACMQAAFLGYEKAYSAIGIYLLTGMGNAAPVNKALGIQFFEFGVAAGQPRAMYNLGRAYEKGEGVEPNDRKALELYKQCYQLEPDNELADKKITMLEERIAANAPNLAAQNPEFLNAHKGNYYAELRNATYLDDLKIAVSELNLDSKACQIEINNGTDSTPGKHLRIAVSSKGYQAQSALISSFEKLGIQYEEKLKGNQLLLIIRPIDMATCNRGFQNELQQHYLSEVIAQTAEKTQASFPKAQLNSSSIKALKTASLVTLEQTIKNLNIDSQGFNTEINPGTENTPGTHLRITSSPQEYGHLMAIKDALDNLGIPYEEKSKGFNQLLIIHQIPPLKAGIEKELLQHYSAALESTSLNNPPLRR